MAEPVRVREISNEEGNRLLRAVRRSSGSIVTWRRSQMVLLSAQGMDPPKIAEVTFTSPDRVRDVIHNFRLSCRFGGHIAPGGGARSRLCPGTEGGVGECITALPSQLPAS